MFSANCGPISWKPDRQALGEAARDGEARQAGHVGRDREHVGERTSRAGSRCARRAGRRPSARSAQTSTSNRSKAAVVLVADQRPHLLRLAVERVVVAGRERVRAEHDPPLGLVAEAVVARALVHRADVAVRRPAGRSGRRRSGPGWRTPPTARSGSSRAARTRPSAAGCTPRSRRRARGRARSCALTCSLTPGSMPSASFSSFGTPTRRPFRSSASGSSTGSGSSTVVESSGSRPATIR